MTSPLSLFYSYSHKDEDLRDRLEAHLATLKRQNLIQQWHDRRILPGEQWAGKIDENLEAAEIILLLISSDFIASDYCFELEMKRAIERHEANEAIVIPIALRPADCTGLPFAEIQGLPKNFKPVAQWDDLDQAFQDIAIGIRRVVEQLQVQRSRNDETNPFSPLGGAVNDSRLFFGRTQEIQRIFELLNNGSSVALIGDAMAGKSSILRAIERLSAQCLTRSRKPIYLNLSQIYGDDDFYQGLCEMAEIPTCSGYNLSRALKPKRLLLLLDQAEQMSWGGFTNPVRAQLRGLADSDDAPLKLVVAARQSLDRLFADSQNTSPFENVCIQEDLKCWTESEIQQLIRSRLVNRSIKFTQQEIARIVEESQGNPGRVMRSCFEVYRQYQRG